MKTHAISDDIYETSRSWANFREVKMSPQKKIDALLDWRIDLQKQLDKEVFCEKRIYIEYEIEATDKLLDKSI